MQKTFLTVLSIFIMGLLFSSAIASDCTAPALLYRVSGPAPNKEFGTSIATIGDVNGDGKTDFIVGAPNASPNGVGAAGSAYIYSGVDGSFLFQKNGISSGAGLGRAVAGIGDINEDGTPDFMVGANVYVAAYSGADSSLLLQLNLSPSSYGTPFAGIGDVNGDGKPDLLIGSAPASSVYVYSIADDSLLYQINGSGSDEFGHSVVGIGDVDEDGHADFIVGAPGADTLNSTWNVNFGAVYVYSGIDGTLLHQVNGTNQWDLLGFSVSNVEDLDGDGKDDFIASGPFGTNSGYFIRSPYAKAFSSASGELIFEKTSGDSVSRFGWSVKRLSDVNGDGTSDFMVAAPGGHDLSLLQFSPIGVVYVYSGSDGTLIYQVKSPVSWDYFGTSIAGLEDIDGNGKADILISAPEDSPQLRSTHPGSVYVFISKTVPKGDLDLDSLLTLSDVVMLLNAVFLDNSSLISPCTADINCDAMLTSVDVVLELNAVFLGTPINCTP